MHGGDIYRNKIKYDFSVNLNPLGIPQKVRTAVCKNIEAIINYPDEKCELLGQKLSQYFLQQENTAIQQDSIIFGNGASELIPAILRAAGSKKVMLVVPGFTGYRKAVASVGAETELFYLKEQDDFELNSSAAKDLITKLKDSKPDTLILTNPNNPNGKLIESEVLNSIAQICGQLKILLVIDECFMTLTGRSAEYSYVPRLSDDKEVILRAFTKTFSFPGLRLGYCLCKNQSFCSLIKNQLPEWNVSTIAQEAGIKALEETDYVKNACSVILEQRMYITEKLKALGFWVFHSDANFILFKSPVLDLKERLIKKQILIRDCSDYEGLGKGFYRVAVKQADENEMLLKTLREVL